MANKNRAREIEEKIRQALEKLGQAVDEWLDKQNPRLQPIPVPVERPYGKRRK